ncbi:MAG: DUF6273 domain-containing protein, partial [Acutalibacteraceae bacterium]|nr:DUF6273 domain-containing protein [Acutalibacteraceae bacterium]
MKNAIKKALSIMLVAVMLFGAAPLNSFIGLDMPDWLDFNRLFEVEAAALKLSSYKVGDIIEFGSYPQREVTDSSLCASLNSVSSNWISYGYYNGTGKTDGDMTPGIFMKYVDVTFNDVKYRGVKFSEYRPQKTIFNCSESNSNQDDNGYYTDTAYWFVYEPLKWRVLDPNDGLILCESIIDAQAFSNTYYFKSSASDYRYSGFNSKYCTNYSSDYETSSIRSWLNDDFYNIAFTDQEKERIGITTLDNRCCSPSYPRLDSVTTDDKVFLLSYDEVQNPSYGFSNDPDQSVTRYAKATAYAKCQGVWVGNTDSAAWDGNSIWGLRTPGELSANACNISCSGSVSTSGATIRSDFGVRPALKINPALAVFTTEKSFSVKTGEKMSLAFGSLISGKLDGEWKKMAITVSDPTVIALSDYEKTEYGYAIDVIGKKQGISNLVVTDAETGENVVLTITVADSFVKTYSYAIDSLPSFYPNNRFENNIQTNIYNLNGIYVNNYQCTKSGNKYKISFNAFNGMHHHAAVDIYNADGNWIGAEKIDKYGMPTSIWDTGEDVFYVFADWEWASYIHNMHSQQSKISFEVPDGGYFEISNNYVESPGCFFYNTADIF